MWTNSGPQRMSNAQTQQHPPGAKPRMSSTHALALTLPVYSVTDNWHDSLSQGAPSADAIASRGQRSSRKPARYLMAARALQPLARLSRRRQPASPPRAAPPRAYEPGSLLFS